MKPTQEQVIEWAHEAGLHIATDVHWMPIIGLKYLEKATALAYEAGRAAEREACAKVCENGTFLHEFSPEAKYGRACARAIRERGRG